MSCLSKDFEALYLCNTDAIEIHHEQNKYSANFSLKCDISKETMWGGGGGGGGGGEGRGGGTKGILSQNKAMI